MAQIRTRVRKKEDSDIRKFARPAFECGGSRTEQPVSHVLWVKRERLKANDYNPNHVPPVEMELLKLSIIEDGWTQPIVVRTDGEIVDGYHRWTCSEDPRVGEMTEYQVPIVVLENVDPDHQRMSTIRHNRARGTHAVVKMADIVRDLRDKYGFDFREIEKSLGMEEEEVERLYSAADMRERGGTDGFGKGWVPDDDT